MSSIRSNASQSRLSITARRHRWVPILATVATLGLAAVTTDAAVIVGNAADAEQTRNSTGYTSGTASGLLAGRSAQSGETGHRSAFFAFDLSGVAGEIETAELGLYLESILTNNTNYNVDLYGVGYAASPDRADWPATAAHLEATSDPATGVVQLAVDFATPTSTVGYLSLGGTTLVDYLNDRTEDVVLFRVNKQSTAGNRTTGYLFTSADSTLTNQHPTLTITAVPEPAAVGLLAAMGFFLARRQRAAGTSVSH